MESQRTVMPSPQQSRSSQEGLSRQVSERSTSRRGHSVSTRGRGQVPWPYDSRKRCRHFADAPRTARSCLSHRPMDLLAADPCMEYYAGVGDGKHCRCQASRCHAPHGPDACGPCGRRWLTAGRSQHSCRYWLSCRVGTRDAPRCAQDLVHRVNRGWCRCDERRSIRYQTSLVGTRRKVCSARLR
jgi:hypothetical protein